MKITTEYTEHTEKFPFRVFRVFRGKNNLLLSSSRVMLRTMKDSGEYR